MHVNFETKLKRGYGQTPNIVIFNDGSILPKLSAYEKIVLSEIIFFCWFSHGENTSYPSHNSISDRSGVSVNTIKRSIKSLVNKGWLLVLNRPNDTSMYDLSLLLAANKKFCIKPCNTSQTPSTHREIEGTSYCECPDYSYTGKCSHSKMNKHDPILSGTPLVSSAQPTNKTKQRAEDAINEY